MEVLLWNMSIRQIQPVAALLLPENKSTQPFRLHTKQERVFWRYFTGSLSGIDIWKIFDCSSGSSSAHEKETFLIAPSYIDSLASDGVPNSVCFHDTRRNLVFLRPLHTVKCCCAYLSEFYWRSERNLKAWIPAKVSKVTGGRPGRVVDKADFLRKHG